jgi:GNAT superfamily N-acetyltransferase
MGQFVIPGGGVPIVRVHKMPLTALPVSPIEALRTIELTLDRAPLLQRFFNENPAYFLATSGELAGPDEAIEEITSDLPAGWSFTKKWVIGYADDHGSLAAMANVITDLLATSVFHIGTFIVATERHGTGDAQVLYRGLEQWAAGNGAAWLRLGVVQGNARAERFWASLGYIPVRERPGIQMGSRSVTVRNMVKPLAGNTLEEYLSLVPRDRREGESAL